MNGVLESRIGQRFLTIINGFRLTVSNTSIVNTLLKSCSANNWFGCMQLNEHLRLMKFHGSFLRLFRIKINKYTINAWSSGFNQSKIEKQP